MILFGSKLLIIAFFSLLRNDFFCLSANVLKRSHGLFIALPQ
ncbi:MAG TPA: hypothetical protein ACHBX0_06250 [Arsenophonus sp.]